MRVALLAIALMGLVLGANAGAVDLTSSNFDTEVFESGKAAFVKFLAPWCVPHRRTPAAPPRDLRRARSSRAAGRDGTIDPPAGRVSPRYPVDRSSRRARDAYRRGHRPARHGTPPTVDPPGPIAKRRLLVLFEPRKSIDAIPRLAPSSSSRSIQVRPLQVDEARLGQARDEYKSSKTVLIADVDCTKEQDLCQKYGVQGYPTIKYFTGATAATGDAYQGGRDYDTLSKWAKDNLGPTCGAENIDLCTDDQKAVIKEKQALSDADLDAEIAAAEGRSSRRTPTSRSSSSPSRRSTRLARRKDEPSRRSPRPSRSSAPSSAPRLAVPRLSSKR